MLCAALTLTTACQQTSIPTEEDPQPSVVEFRASSQATWVKSASSTFSDYHPDFGVWGIANEPLNMPYILWDDNDLTQVTKPQGSDVYVPISPAYWFNSYTYNFIAIAPFTNSGITSTSVNSATNTLTFNYNIKNKYDLKGVEGKSAKDHYEFDLMGAVDQVGPVSSSTASTQTLIFWHLFSKITVNVTFADATGTPVNTGTVSQMRLCNVDTDGTYTVAYDDEQENDLSVAFANGTNSNATLILEGSTGCFHIVPQTVTGFEMYIDFTLNNVEYKDFKLNLNVAGNPTYYGYNQSYNWNITIGPKSVIDFAVTIADWDEDTVGDDNGIKII